MDNLPSNYDKWRLDSPDEKTWCSCCEHDTAEKDLIESVLGDSLCEACSEQYDLCSSCDRPMDGDNSYNDETCDSCMEKLADKLQDSIEDGE